MVHLVKSLGLNNTLLTVHLDLAGNWGNMLPSAIETVLNRMRHACLDGIRLLSDRQPDRLRVDEHTSGLPSIWLHPDGSSMAWIIVDAGERAWCQLAYQFGHELGHVLANSWQPDANPAPPCQWLEEAMVEAFSLHGVARLATAWARNPPFANDGAYSTAIEAYRLDIIKRYAQLAAEQGNIGNLPAWFAAHRGEMEPAAALSRFAQAASLSILAEYERQPDCMEALGALNRWPGRSGVPLSEYLRLWEKSCAELHASAALPVRLREMLAVK